MGLIDFTHFVNELATQSGQAILPFFRTAIATEDKSRGGAFDPVTEADRASEATMRHLIKRSFPTHGIVGEEFGAERADADYVWVLDPIDGTRGFISGLPTWGTLIGLMKSGAPVYGLMSQPFVKERFWGDGGSARYRGPLGDRKLRVRSCARLEDAVMSATSPRLFVGKELKAFETIEQTVRLTRYGGATAEYIKAFGNTLAKRYPDEIHSPALMGRKTDALLKAGFKESEVEKIMGRNLYRAFGEIWGNA